MLIHQFCYVAKILACLCLLGLAGVAYSAAEKDGLANSRDVSVSYCPDSAVPMTISQAKLCDYGDYDKASTQALYAHTRWAKVNARTTGHSELLTIEVAPHLLRQVEVFDSDSERLVAGPVGMDFPYSSKHGLLAGYSFNLQLDSPGTHIYYVRIVTADVPYGFVEASLDPVAALRTNQQTGLSLGLHYGILSILLLLSSGVYIATRDRSIGVFVLNILNLFARTLLGSGFLLAHLWPNWPMFNGMLFGSTLYLMPALWMLLLQTLLAPYRTPEWYSLICKAFYLMTLCTLVMLWADMNYISIWLVFSFGFILLPLLQALVIHYTRDIRSFYKKTLIVSSLMWVTMVITGAFMMLYSTDNPRLAIQVSRILDYSIPLILMVLVVAHYRETIRQLNLSTEQNAHMQLRLELEGKMREDRKLMVDMLAHELKNPLSSISLAIGSLARTLRHNESPVKRRLENIRHSVSSMDSVIERCKLMNQLDENLLRCRPEAINPSELVNRIIAISANSKRVVLVKTGSDRFVTDPQFFQMIASNLIENALKYSHTSTGIKVSLQQRLINCKPYLVLEVSNRIGSQGFPDRNMVFKRFYRNPLAQGSSGSGVGLYLVRTLTELMNGRIDFHCDHESVTFTVELPEAAIHE